MKYGCKVKFVLRYALSLVEIFHLSLGTTSSILSSGEVTTACYSLAELYVKYVYLNLFGWRGGAKFIKHFTGGSGYKSFGTSGLCPDVITHFQARVRLCGAPTEIGSVHPSTTNNARAAEQVFIKSLTAEFY
jgi:hypothetical protein